MAGIGPAQVIDAPPLTPPPNGLLNSAQVIDHADDGEDARWMNGVTFVPENCDNASVFDPCAAVTDVISTLTDGSTTQASTTLTSPTAEFASEDVGKGVSAPTTANATTADGVTTQNSTTLTSATMAFTADDVGKAISSAATANAVYADGVTNTDTSLVSATAGFTANDVGKTVTGAGIPASTTIASVTNATTVVLSQATTATAAGVSITIVARLAIIPGVTISSFTNATTVVLSTASKATTAASSITITARKIIATGATIASVTNATTAVLSIPAKATSTNVVFTIAGRLPNTNRRSANLFMPFGVEAEDTCSAFGYEKSDYEGRARRALAARETKAVETEFWAGTLMPGNRHLADSGTTSGTANVTQLAGGAAQGLRTGLALLVQAIADYNLGKGMIHARPGLVTQWTAMQLLRWENGKLYTMYGNLVVPGAGYLGTSPSAAAPTTTSEWAYATGSVQVHRSEVEVFAPEPLDGPLSQQNVDYQNNLVTLRAQRMYSAVFNACAVVGVNINPTQTT